MGGGTWLEDFEGVRYGGRMNSDIYYRVYGKYFDRSSETFSDGTNSQDSWNWSQGGFRLDAGDTGHDKLTLQGDLSSGTSNDLPGGEGTPPAQGNSGDGNLLGRWSHTFEENSEMTLQAYYDYTHLGVPFQSSGSIPAGTLNDGLDTLDVDFQDRFHATVWDYIVWGLDYRYTHDVVQDAPLVAFLPETLDHYLYSGFLQDEVRVFENLSITIGSKIEHNDYTGYEFEPSGRIKWDITDKQMFWGAVSRAVRMPARYDRDLAEPSPAYGIFLDANSGFESETVIAYELGYRAQLDMNFSTSLSTFFNNYDNLRSLSFTPVTFLPFFFANNLEGQTWGMEWTCDYQALSGWRLHAGYDLIQDNLWIKPGQIDLSHGLAETADPANQVFLRSSMDLPGQTELDADCRWVDAVYNGSLGATKPAVLPSYAELDVHAGWHPAANLEISVIGQNLLQDEHVEAGVPGPAQEQIARSIYGKLTCQF
jgi:iron complex outermembrane receptor protein